MVMFVFLSIKTNEVRFLIVLEYLFVELDKEVESDILQILYT